jgi:predicted O-linked N-acetylglucosamine transferase (SPINDLY family)
VAETGRDYVDLAVRLATDRAFMTDLRTRIAAALADSPLTDMVSHTRHLEAAYVAALRTAAPEVIQGLRAEAAT